MSAPVVERQPFRYLVKSCYGPRSKSIENADESMRDSIESARQYFGAEHEIDAVKAKSLVYISPGEWFAIPLYTAPPELAELQATIAQQGKQFEHLKKRALAVIQEAMDGAVVHPCDEHSEDVKARTLAPAYQELYASLTSAVEHPAELSEQPPLMITLADHKLGQAAYLEHIKELQATLAKLTAENERLKGGQV